MFILLFFKGYGGVCYFGVSIYSTCSTKIALAATCPNLGVLAESIYTGVKEAFVTVCLTGCTGALIVTSFATGFSYVG